MAAISSVDRLSPTKRAVAASVLEKRRAAAVSRGPRPRDGSQPLPLSFSQRRIWFLQQWAPEAPTFNATRAFRLSGDLDADALRRSLDGLMERHDALRTVYRAQDDGEPRQIVLDHEPVALPVIDLPAATAGDEAHLTDLMRDLAREPFDLAADRMMRVTLIRLADREHVLLLRLHHIAGDAYSAAVMVSELGALYNAHVAGRPPALAAPEIQVGDFAEWERERLQGPLLAELTAYWVAQLEGAPALLALPTDRPRREVQRHEGAHRHFALPADLTQGINALAREERATTYIVTLAAFATLLYRLGGEDDVVVGSPMANRTHAELAGLVGFVSNTVALRVRLNGNPSFREIVGRTREVVLGALSHQEMPFEQIVSALQLPRDPGHNPVFQVNFRAQATKPPVPEMTGLTATPLSVDIGYSRFDLAVELQVGDDGLVGYFEYDLDLFDAPSIDACVEALGELLEGVLADPDQPILAIALPSVGPPGGRGARRPKPKRDRRRADTEQA
jgi:hypothetical protein